MGFLIFITLILIFITLILILIIPTLAFISNLNQLIILYYKVCKILELILKLY
jgi:hypothetical protein